MWLLLDPSWSPAHGHKATIFILPALLHYAISFILQGLLWINTWLCLYSLFCLLNFQFKFSRYLVFFQSQPNSFNKMFTETGQVAVCKSYLKRLRKWGSAVLILTSQGAVSSFLKLHHGYSIPFPPQAHPDDVLHTCSQHRWVNSFHHLMRHAWKYRTRRNDNRPFYPKYRYSYLDCAWKIFVILLL